MCVCVCVYVCVYVYMYVRMCCDEVLHAFFVFLKKMNVYKSKKTNKCIRICNYSHHCLYYSDRFYTYITMISRKMEKNNLSLKVKRNIKNEKKQQNMKIFLLKQ